MRQVSRKAEPLSTSATVAAIAVVIKTRKCHHVTPLRQTGFARYCYLLCCVSQSENRLRHIARPVSTFPNEFRSFMLHGATPAETLFCNAVAHNFQLGVSTCNSGLSGISLRICILAKTNTIFPFLEFIKSEL